MPSTSYHGFTALRSEGGLLPADLLGHIAAGSSGLPGGLDPAAYHLSGERLNEAITRAWNRCLLAWASFSEEAQRLPPADRGTTLTRERLLQPLFNALDYGRLPFVGSQRPLAADGAPQPDAQPVPLSHLWGRVPLHLVSFRQGLDSKAEGERSSPHSLLQDFLNRSEGCLWGIVSNGLRLRLLRDNKSLTRPAYLEFDLEAVLSGQLYADFALLWLICHESRLEGQPTECWLERWAQHAALQGVRALDDLRQSVQEAICVLGRGFLAHPANAALRAALHDAGLSPAEYYGQLLRLVYRLIILFVAEERDLLLDPACAAPARQLYTEHYSAGRLRALAGRLPGGPHPDLYRSLRRLFGLLRLGYPPLGLPALNGRLFEPAACPQIDAAELSNADLLAALRALAFTAEGGRRRPIDYARLGSEELGSVYESLLELHPRLCIDPPTFSLEQGAGSERKTTGSYYTPASLVSRLLDSALEPAIRERLAAAGRDSAAAQAALLSLRIVDPACGSGHFLIAAAHRLAGHLARLRSGDAEPAPLAQRQALRDVVRQCIFGVDLNPMAVELCKVALWMETLEPGKPLPFLEAHIQCGNSLIGATPDLLRQGIPDAAFEPIEGDDKAFCAEWRKQNKKQRGQPTFLAIDGRPWERLGDLAGGMARLETQPDDSAGDVARKQTDYAELVQSSGYRVNRLLADAWCAAFLIRKSNAAGAPPYPITEEIFRQIEHNPWNIEPWLAQEIGRLAGQYGFFHWRLAFPHIFGPDGQSGFDVVLGNPPWERVKLQEQEWFAVHRPEIALAPNAAQRKALIDALLRSDPTLHAAFLQARRAAQGESQFVRRSGRFPLCGCGDVNTFALFAELMGALQGSRGRAGLIVPTGIATDDTTKAFFQDITDNGSLASLFDFENRQGIFPAVHSCVKFSLLSLRGGRPGAAAAQAAEFVFFAQSAAALDEPARRVRLSAADIALLNPNTRTCPIFRSRQDADLTLAIYRRMPVLIHEGRAENPWGVRFLRMVDMSNDSGLFRTRRQLEGQGWELHGNRFARAGAEYLPLYEAKMMHQFDHRWGSYEGDAVRDLRDDEKADPGRLVLPRYWVPAPTVRQRLGGRSAGWLVGFRDITNATNERTAIFSVLPEVGVGHTCPLIFFDPFSAESAICIAPMVNSLVFDYVTRQKVGGTHLTYGFLKQLPALPPGVFQGPCPWQAGRSLADWLRPRVLELTYTAEDLTPFARGLGHTEPPFAWQPERRLALRCELDTAFFHLYGLGRAETEYIVETFTGVCKNDQKRYGAYRTRDLILAAYDALVAPS